MKAVHEHAEHEPSSDLAETVLCCPSQGYPRHENILAWEGNEQSLEEFGIDDGENIRPKELPPERIWLLPEVPPEKTARPLVIYFLKSPTNYALVLVVAGNLSPGVPGFTDDLVDQCDQDNRFTNQPISFPIDESWSCLPPVLQLPAVGVGQPGKVSEFIIGRSLECFQRIPDSARNCISRRHCSVVCSANPPAQNGEIFFVLKDLKSTNKTYLNGIALVKGGSVPLNSGDLIGVSVGEPGSLIIGFRFSTNFVSQRVVFDTSII